MNIRIDWRCRRCGANGTLKWFVPFSLIAAEREVWAQHTKANAQCDEMIEVLDDLRIEVDEDETAWSPLTKRQREIVNYLSEFAAANGYAPSFEEIARRFNYASLATVHEHLTNLERKGWIRRRYNEARALEVLERRGAA